MSERAFRSTKAADAAVVLPVFGMFLLMPPLISLFATPAAIRGVPLIVLYLFAVWGGLIVCAALLARRLDPAVAQPQSEAAAGTPPA
jgi:hypothetical protein